MSYVQAEVMTENGASYIVRAAFCGGGGAWLSAPDEHGMRNLGDRERAAVFTSLESARAAIAKMPPILADALVEFVAEPLLDGPAPNANCGPGRDAPLPAVTFRRSNRIDQIGAQARPRHFLWRGFFFALLALAIGDLGSTASVVSHAVGILLSAARRGGLWPGCFRLWLSRRTISERRCGGRCSRRWQPLTARRYGMRRGGCVAR